MSRRRLGSTYRMQLAEIGFVGARAQVGYLNQLGIETLYVSPILAAVPGSAHGYDVIDPTRLDPALGTKDDFEALLAELESFAMGLLVDIVPNHMAVDKTNLWWWDVLRIGPQSEHADTFDIDWKEHGCRVLVPILSRPLAELRDKARVIREGRESILEIDGQLFPLSGETADKTDIEKLLEAQHYRPAYWRLSRHESNYRRFFDIDGLIGVRVEDPCVFERTHGFLLELCKDTRVTGLRIDHIDGLADPGGYTERLSTSLARTRDDVVIVVEKILSGNETLPPSWAVGGTTGYEFANRAGGLFVQARGARALAQLGAELTGEPQVFKDLLVEAKREALNKSFAAALERLARQVLCALDLDQPGHDLSLADICEALSEMTVHLAVYRTYLNGSSVDPIDRLRLEAACLAGELSKEARRASELIKQGLLEPRARSGTWLEVALRWQQLSGAVMAKGVEDTATYRYSGLLSHAEVGCDPDNPTTSLAEFQRFAQARRKYAACLNATSTHDSKRNEDARARLFALSEATEEWTRLVRTWHNRYAKAGIFVPEVHDELLAYQTLLVLWPFASPRISSADRRRVKAYAIKAAREAKRSTDWLDPNSNYENAISTFVIRVTRDPRFCREMTRFVEHIGRAAVSNSLALCLLKAITPGVADFYQGTELFEPALTDPDNRRPVDYSRRQALIASLLPLDAPAGERATQAKGLLDEWADGRLKLFLIRTLLHLRRDDPVLFEQGTFRILEVEGSHRDHLIVLARRHRRRCVFAVLASGSLEVAGVGRFPIGQRVWGDTTVIMPDWAPTLLVDSLTGTRFGINRNKLRASEALSLLPCAVLVPESTAGARVASNKEQVVHPL